MEKNAKKVLIIEDDIYVIRAYTIKFQKENVSVESISDGDKALEYIEKNPPTEVVILDLMIPKKSGFEVLTALKGNKNWKDVPVIILSNLGQDEDIEKGKKLGAVDYIVKASTNIEEVIARVKKYLSP
ncbi:response regulator [Candidatus Wolfebacteria bacterium]|nr:response regulator [Candidatus Wolfebacteria bacterium]